MSTDFFQQQDLARRRTGRLVFLFVAAVISIITAIYLAMIVIFDAGHGSRHLWNPELLLAVSAATLVVVVLGAVYKTIELSSGGEAVALLLGGRPVNPQTQDLAERRLLNVVEEMALASGLPVPPVYVLDHEPSINAFAAGHQPSDAVIGVSRGCLEYLTRDELQGVMGHEFSHILNGDMRLDLRLTGTIFGILVLAVLGYYIMRFTSISGRSSSSDDKKSGGAEAAIFVLGLALMVIGYVGVFFGKLIKAAVSRQREYLADSAAVQFTRYPAGIAGALKKIGGLPASSRIADAHAEEVSHMFFSDAFEGMFLNFFATHPPLDERIRRLDPTFDGQFPTVAPLAQEVADDASGPSTGPAPEEMDRFLASFGRDRHAQGSAKAVALHPADMTGRAGMPGAAAMLYASALVASMPPPLAAAAREPYSARALVYALLLSSEQEVRGRQVSYLQQQIEGPLIAELQQLATQVDPLGDQGRLALADMLLPALKRLSPSQYDAFRDTVEGLIQADRRIDLFEYMIRTMVLRRLDVQFGRAKPIAPRCNSLAALQSPLVVVLSTLAHAGQAAEADAQSAFQQGIARIGDGLSMLAKDQCSLGALDEALKQLAQAAPNLKKTILDACVACIAADGKVTIREAELLRAVAAMLDCPVPPVVEHHGDTENTEGTKRPEG